MWKGSCGPGGARGGRSASSMTPQSRSGSHFDAALCSTAETTSSGKWGTKQGVGEQGWRGTRQGGGERYGKEQQTLGHKPKSNKVRAPSLPAPSPQPALGSGGSCFGFSGKG